MNKEQIYDAQIAPLMTQIIAICKAEKIAMMATFSIPNDEDDNLACTTALLADDFNPPEPMIRAHASLRMSLAPLMVTTRNADGNVTRMDAIL